VRSLVFLYKEFLRSLSLNRFLHFTYGVQVTISLLVLGIFFVLLVGSLMLWNRLGENMRIHVYLVEGVTPDQRQQLSVHLEGLPHVVDVEYRDQEEALRIIQDKNPNLQLDEFKEDIPLPESFVVSVDHPANIDTTVSLIEGRSGVDVVKYGKSILRSYLKLLAVLGFVCLATMVLLILFTSSSISNIISMSIYARRTEIRIQQLVGATWWFIRWPFVFEGVFVGFVGAVVAAVVILGLMSVMSNAVRASNTDLVLPYLGVDQVLLVFGLAGLLIVVGVTVGFVGSIRAVNRFLGKEMELQLDSQKVRHLVR
jgi:cell division transport system permease protein